MSAVRPCFIGDEVRHPTQVVQVLERAHVHPPVSHRPSLEEEERRAHE
jgi:hypothetical protein